MTVSVSCFVICVLFEIFFTLLGLLIWSVYWWVKKKDFFDKVGKELDARLELGTVDSEEVGDGNNQPARPNYELRQFEISQSCYESKEDPVEQGHHSSVRLLSIPHPAQQLQVPQHVPGRLP
jgi:hypothetical protein